MRRSRFSDQQFALALGQVPPGAVLGVQCRPGCRDMPLYAAICRSLERKLLIFLGVGFFSEAGSRAFESRPSSVIFTTRVPQLSQSRVTKAASPYAARTPPSRSASNSVGMNAYPLPTE